MERSMSDFPLLYSRIQMLAYPCSSCNNTWLVHLCETYTDGMGLDWMESFFPDVLILEWMRSTIYSSIWVSQRVLGLCWFSWGAGCLAYAAEYDLYSSSSSRNGITSFTDKILWKWSCWFSNTYIPSILERSHVESAMAFRVYHRFFLVQHLNSYM